MLGASHTSTSFAKDIPLLSILATSDHEFLQPTPGLHADALKLAKNYLDPLAAATCEAQQRRLSAARKKRKRGESDEHEEQHPLRLKELYLDGFHLDQIWEQARRALDANTQELEKSLAARVRRDIDGRRPSSKSQRQTANKSLRSIAKERNSNLDEYPEDEDGQASDVLDDSASEILGDADNMDGEGERLSLNLTDGGESGKEPDIAEGQNLELDMQDDDSIGASENDQETQEVFVSDKHGLNDGFFSIDDFNRQSEFLERQDARGEDDDAASDEEDVDWGLDPSSVPLPKRSDAAAQLEDGQESESEEEGPTFGNADLSGVDVSESDGADEDDMPLDSIGLMNNTNDIKYADFFAPPARKVTKSARMRALPKTQPTDYSSTSQANGDADDIQRTISAVRRDIFEDDLTPSPPSSPPSSPTHPTQVPRSSHETRQKALTAEIRRLEAAALKERSWQLRGEARASDRPLNSLLEEDLDFERVGKPVPVITPAVSEDIEALIKRRILAREFDEVIRRRPGSFLAPSAQQNNKEQQRRGLLAELSTEKPEKGLAEQYEEEHLRAVDPTGHPDPIDAKTQATQDEISALWKTVSAQLDALTSCHFKPKPPDVEVRVVEGVPAIRVEDARPAGVEGMSGAVDSRLAPQEIYRPGDRDGNDDGKSAAGEVRTKGGLPVGKEEMVREDRRRRRRREKERARKTSGVKGDEIVKGAESGRTNKQKRKDVNDEQQGVVKELKKSGIKVIGRKGELRDVDGRTVNARSGGQGVGRFKL